MLIKNFLFHRVNDEIDRIWPPMKPALFEKAVRFLTKHYSVIGLEDYLVNNKTFREFSKKAATILFDDGYKDNIEYAAPILKKYNCPASFYVVTDCMSSNSLIWTYVLDYLLQRTSIKNISLEFDFVPVQLRNFQPKNNEAIATIKPWMKGLTNDLRKTVIGAIQKQCSDIDVPVNKMMNWDDVRQLKAEGFYIGSHSHTHPVLSSIENESEIESELNTSFFTIKKELGEEPLTISYPNGSYDDRVVRLASKVGYKYGLAVGTRSYNSSTNNLMTIPRLELYQESWWKLKARTTSMYEFAKRFQH